MGRSASLSDILVFMCPYNLKKYFDVNDVDEKFNIENDASTNITEKPSTSRAVKRPFVEVKDEPLDDSISLKRIYLEQDPDIMCSHLENESDATPLIVVTPKMEIKSEYFTEDTDAIPLFVMSPKMEIKSEYLTEEISTVLDTNNDEQTVQYHSISDRCNICEESEQYAMKKELILRPYRRNSIFSLGFNSSIYKDAIKKIDIIDSNGSFSNSILEGIHDLIENKNFEISSVDLSKTYSNVCEYILHKVYPFLDDIISTADVPITPGMSISNIKYNCVLNNLFFEKLGENCEKIVHDICLAPDYSLLNVFQRCISFNYCSGAVSVRPKFFVSSKNRDVFCSKLKELIIDSIYNLPRSIIWELENFDQSDIVNGLFSDVHGVFLSKSSIRDLNCFFNSTKNEVPSSNFADNLGLLNRLLEKIGDLVRKSCIFYEGEVFLLDESMVEELSKYLLSDMYEVPIKFHKDLKLFSKNMSKLKKLSASENVELRLPKLDLVTNATTVNNEIEISQQQDNCNPLQRGVALKILKSRKYRFQNSWYKMFSENIYEDAIKKIDIDSNGLFKNSVLDEIDGIIKNKGLSKSSVDLSLTYSNVRKYVLDKVSPYINNIISVDDILITSGMSISDIKFNCTSNHAFFKKLYEICEKIVESIRVIPEDLFLNIIQSYVRFGLDFRVKFDYKRSKFCLKIKELIIETISNLSQSIIFEIEKFEQNDIVNGLFSYVHDVLVSKSSIRKVRSFLNSQKNKFSDGNSKDNINLFNNLLEILSGMLKTSVIFHEEKIIIPDIPMVKLLSKYFLLDMYNIDRKLRKYFKMYDESIVNTNDSRSLKSTSIVGYKAANTEMQSPKNEEFIPKSNYKWNPDLITFLNIYELAISMIDIDKVEFEDYFLNKMRLTSTVVAKFSDKIKIKPDLSVTYRRIKNYILEIFIPFLKKNEKETKAKIELYHGMPLDELVIAYRSNEEFFARLRNFCNEVITCIKGRSDRILTGMMQSFVCLYIESMIIKKVDLRRYKGEFNNCMLELLFKNISSIPEKIVDSIVLLPRSKIVEEYFSFFYDMYVDNKSLLKAKLVFDATKQKIMSDVMLSELVNKISLDMVSKFGVSMRQNLYRFINGYIVCENLSTINYIRKLVREEFSALRGSMTDSIMIIRHDKVEVADQKIRCEILCRLESDLLTVSIKLYINFCISQYRLKNKEYITTDSIVKKL